MITLYKHQKKLLETETRKRLLIAWGTGSGKTLAALKLAEKNSDNALVVCPKSIKQQWYEQIEKFGEKPMDWEVVTKEEFKKRWKELPKYDCVIIDEFHFHLGHRSMLHKTTFAYFKKHNPEFIYGLTATPYLSTIMNIYSAERLLGWKPNYQAYQIHYFNQIRMGYRVVPVQKKNLEKTVARICKKIGSIVKLEDCIDMPEQIFQQEYFNLTEEQKEAIANIKDINHIVRWTKTHQIMGGTLKGDGYTENQTFKTEKLARLLEICSEHDKIVVVCRYNLEVELIYSAISRDLPHRAIKITGKTPDRHLDLKIAEMQEKCVVIANACCSVGWELPSFPLMIFYSYDFSLVNYLQMIGRISRINNPKKNVYLSLLIDKPSIDYDVFNNVVNEKQDFQIELYAKDRS